ncbi:hypothetical protein E8L99_21630 [Phreatobacter aquaticus]|uniref:Uncharacterized protein n=1 Tax=Phreatobacter aquaticus TaxID=2570229 RepID=A0A4D7QRG5_9HYPH|nr:hypothetical protein [Phreatobacter aquaticus]QCK88176.1 hypothetical protein E8L99_21630 [Phreatobacter aquaticus]
MNDLSRLVENPSRFLDEMLELDDSEWLLPFSGEVPKESFIGRRADIGAHLISLAHEFVGDRRVCFLVAATIVRIRRCCDLENSLARFRFIWGAHRQTLLRELSLRWLVSCLDTLVDYGRDDAEKALAISGVSLVVMTKLYETERLIRRSVDAQPGAAAVSLANPVPLFDGLTSFSIGWGDMISNFSKRLERQCIGSALAGPIVMEIFRRLTLNETVLKRFAAAHIDGATKWI